MRWPSPVTTWVGCWLLSTGSRPGSYFSRVSRVTRSPRLPGAARKRARRAAVGAGWAPLATAAKPRCAEICVPTGRFPVSDHPQRCPAEIREGRWGTYMPERMRSITVGRRHSAKCVPHVIQPGSDAVRRAPACRVAGPRGDRRQRHPGMVPIPCFDARPAPSRSPGPSHTARLRPAPRSQEKDPRIPCPAPPPGRNDSIARQVFTSIGAVGAADAVLPVINRSPPARRAAIRARAVPTAAAFALSGFTRFRFAFRGVRLPPVAKVGTGQCRWLADGRPKTADAAPHRSSRCPVSRFSVPVCRGLAGSNRSSAVRRVPYGRGGAAAGRV